MTDDKRFLRRLKRQIKKDGNRKRRRFLKNINANADEFDFGHDRSDVMNEPDQDAPRRDHEADVG